MAFKLHLKTADKIILQELKSHVWKLVFVLFIMFTNVGFEALAPWPFKFLIDNVLGNETLDPHSFIGMIAAKFPDQQSLGYGVVAVFFIISIASSFSEYFESITVKRVIKDIVFQFSQSAFRNMEKLDMGFFRRQEVGDFIYRLSYDVSALGDFIEDGVLPIVTSTTYLIFTTAIMFTISVKLTLISLAAMPLLAVALSIFNKHIGQVTKRSERWNSLLFSFVQQALTQLKIIQAFSQEKNEAKEFDATKETSLKMDLKLYKLDFLLSLFIGAIIAISYSVIIAIGIDYFFNGELSTGLLIVFIFYLDNLTVPVQNVIYAATSAKEAYIKIVRMKEFFTTSTHTKDVGVIKDMANTAIEFRNVSLEGEKGNHILRNVSFKVEEGSLTVLVGVSGSGKTSIISLIPRLINEPTGGEIVIGGKNIKDYEIGVLRNNISLVPQENILFDEKIEDIIRYGNTEATKEDIKKAAILAAANDFINEHPSGYNFRVGEGGNYLSGGQRQRLMLARAFLKNPKIMIYDEPLSALDLKTRSKIWKTIQEIAKGKTVIMVSNVLDVITKADQVIVVNKGRIVHTNKKRGTIKESELYSLID